ncbi:MAG: MBL fold metallo-hydrolase [Thermoguttaceae bacterium]
MHPKPDPVKLVLLGTGGYHPNDRRQTACMMIPEHGVMLDAGTALYRAARYLKTPDLDIFLTHAHLDHVIGLTYLFNVLRVRPVERVRIYGIAEKLAAIEEHLFAAPLFPTRPPWQFVPLAGQVGLAGGGRLRYFSLVHPGGAIGFRLDWPGHSLAYVTDTTAAPDAAYLQQVRGVNLLVHECHFPDSQADWAGRTGHSHTTAAAELARRAGAGRLVLVHFNPLCPEADPIGLRAARSVFPRTDLGEDLMELEF